LTLGRTIRIAIDGVRYRLFRAAVTVCVIAVAVAFLMNILSESLIKRRLAAGARQDLSEMRMVHSWASRLTRPSEPEEILASAARAGALESFGSVLGGDEEQARFTGLARSAAAYLDFFDDLDYDRRRTLIHTTRGIAIFDALRDPDRLATFEARLAEMAAVRFVTSVDEFRVFLDAWPGLSSDVAKLITAQRAATDKLNAVRGSRTVFEALAQEGGAFATAAREAGLPISEETAAQLAQQAQTVLDRQAVERSLSLLESRQLLAQHFDLLPADISANELWEFLEKPRHAAAYLDALASLAPDLKRYPGERLVALASDRREELALERIERLTTGAGTGWLGLGERMAWLLTVSMLVCAIGISNAMLMTVTERFREIATMKCLGALDGFIMLLFVLESCFLGLAGGIFGSLLGDLIGYGRMAVRFGMGVFAIVPLGELLSAMGSAIGVGVVLAAVAAVYPSLKAARLAPMEAMRVE
jgi:putative ABC transport system permease protein